MSTIGEKSHIPSPALLLGAAGLIPFVGLSVGVFLYAGLMQSELAFALICYGAVILSFLGGIHWGLAMGVPEHLNLRYLTISVIPSLVAWAALLLVEHKAMLLLLVSFILMLFIDIVSTSKQMFPGWYVRLRVGLTAVVCLSLLAAFVQLR